MRLKRDIQSDANSLAKGAQCENQIFEMMRVQDLIGRRDRKVLLF
jgi:hypothetical protein